RILAATAEPFRVRDHVVGVTASIGVVLPGQWTTAVSEPGITRRAHQLLSEADTAMYQAKLRGRGRQETYGDGAPAPSQG
ncbi:diguanylate cyclase domain-containing protein, partial [Klebsiella michiganensis]|uniref:diguanylate cyclase domain-containing protein n=1 Tax=Klebsiella michiganensis TaxID=1134687 RepID=UPI0016438691